ncbi:MAG TPA: hypothetical protein VKV19_20540 [Ktedonobacteraceae bacterium]|nr:hypothetical protein [Ktedonobacteraceae bacterium]
MAQSEFYQSFAEDSARPSGLCAQCGDIAKIHIVLLEETPQRSGSFCLPCGEIVVHNLRQQEAAYHRTNLAAAEKAHAVSLHSSTLHEDAEGGIIFWEGHGWSSDGPFAGA